MVERLFKLKENKTNIRTEVIAGITTFMTMAYILAVNPSILGDAGMNTTAVMMATAISSCIATIAMALLANYPFALAPGMGLNLYFAYTVCGTLGYSWQFALFAVFVEGIIFIILSLTHVREAIFNAIPLQLKHGVSIGIGLFVGFIGLQNGGLVVKNDDTMLGIVNFTEDFSTTGICAVLCIIGVFIIAVLSIKKVRGSILIGIILTWILGMICQVMGIYQGPSMFPSWSNFDLGAIGDTFGQCFTVDFSNVKILDFIVIMFAFLFVDIFETLGTLIGVAEKADMLDEDGHLERLRPSLLADSIGTVVGAIFGTSTVSAYVESSAGIAEGGRTGLTAIVTGGLFLLAIFLSPIFIAIPSFATASALIYVGFLMLDEVLQIDFHDMTEAIPAYLCLMAMPFMYSIADGIAIGIISYVVINIFAGKAKKITPLMYALAVLFIVRYIFL